MGGWDAREGREDELMCGIAGVVDLTGRRPVPRGAARAMASALIHRGPDEDGFLERPGLSLASRRLSIVGLADGRQPITNEDQSISVVYNGELFDYPETKARLQARGHRFATHCDTEIIPHLWEEYGEQMFDHLRGQFAFVLWDQRRQLLILARDRFGICPLYWTRQQHSGGEWLLFASEIKALLASGLVAARPDPLGIDQIFTFFAIPGRVTCFKGVEILLPGRYLRIQLGQQDGPAALSEHIYWDFDFPDQGMEEVGQNPKQLVDQFEEVLLKAVGKRLRADVPVVSYLSGGVDSSMVVALASHIRKQPIPTFTIRIKDPKLDETKAATFIARHIGTDPVVVNCGAEEVLNTYPELIRAAEGPVVDTSCTALLLLARKVHSLGYKVALTGEGSDEWLAGYPWHKIHKALSFLDIIPGVPLSAMLRRLFLNVPRGTWNLTQRAQQAVGGHNGWLDIYTLMSMSRLRFFSPDMVKTTEDHLAYDDLGLNLERMRRWHPLNRALGLGARILLPGLLLLGKGDRVAMNSSVETRYPFLDEDVFTFLAGLHPRWKLHGFRDKYLLRLLAERWLPPSVVHRPKVIFRAPFDSFHADQRPAFVKQLLSEESLRKSGYFNVDAVLYWQKAFRSVRFRPNIRLSLEMGLVAVLATQLWHHTFIDPSLADLPGWEPKTDMSMAEAVA